MAYRSGGNIMLTRKCDFCNKQATVDAKTIYGPWAYMCDEHNKMYGVKAFQTKLANLSEGGSLIKPKEEK
jgi:hypothetical protein